MPKSLQRVAPTEDHAAGAVVNVGITTAAAPQSQFRLLISMGNHSPAPTPLPRQYPDHSYVSVVAVTKGGAAVVAAISVLSLFMKFANGSVLIDPVASVLLLVASAAFYLIGKKLEKTPKK
jgi:hypothetical protein